MRPCWLEKLGEGAASGTTGAAESASGRRKRLKTDVRRRLRGTARPASLIGIQPAESADGVHESHTLSCLPAVRNSLPVSPSWRRKWHTAQVTSGGLSDAFATEVGHYQARQPESNDHINPNNATSM